MTLKEVLAKYYNAPIEQSLDMVADALNISPVLVAVRNPDPNDLELHVATDKEGHFWIYAFSDKDELSKTFPSGAAFVEMNFANVLEMIGPDERFGGVFINSKSEAMFVVPRQLFGNVYQRIKKQAG